MHKPKVGQRIVTFEEFMRRPRTSGEIQAYHGVLAAAQALGWVDKDLNIVGPEGRASNDQ